MKQHVVLWSGGYDSTLILDDLIKKGNNPLALTLTHVKAPAIENEKSAREVIKKKLPPFEHIENMFGKQSDTDYLLEKWVADIVPHLANDVILYMGVHISENFKNRDDCNHIDLAFKNEGIDEGKKIDMRYPLIGMTKTQVLNKLITTGLFQDCWSCSNPQGVFPCGLCVECTNLNNALGEIGIE